MYATLENVSEKERKNQLNNTYLHKFNFSLKDINMSWVEYSFTFAIVRQKVVRYAPRLNQRKCKPNL